MAEEVKKNDQLEEPEVVVKAVEPPENKPSKGNKFWGAVKEWFRKRIVALKVKPNVIPLIVLLITSIVFMLSLYKYSEAVYWTSGEEGANVQGAGVCIFVTTLLSLLILVSFLNAFPKRKKPNIFFIVLVGVMIAAMIACDVVYYLKMAQCVAKYPSQATYINPAQPLVIAHIVMLGISAIVFALLPAYTKLIRMIPTAKKIESATEHMGEKIDIEEDND